MSKRQSKKNRILAVRVQDWLAEAVEEEAQKTGNPAAYVIRAVLTKEFRDEREEDVDEDGN